MWKIKNNGKIFWIVDNKIAIGQLILTITIGNQKWSGAIPSFINILNKIMIENDFGELKMYIKFVLENATNKSLDASAWIKKYLILASVSWRWEEEASIGIKEKRFNSNKIHRRSQWLVDRAIIILNDKVERNSIENGKNIIKNKKGVEPLKLRLEVFV